MEHTTLLFLEQNNRLENQSIVISSGTDEDGSYFVPEQTCFYSGGGGQEADKAILVSADTKLTILKARWINGEHRHYIAGNHVPANGESIVIKVDRANRLLNNRLHTAGHLISSVVNEEINTDLITAKGFHYQQGSFVEFSRQSEGIELDREQLNNILKMRIQQDLPVGISIVSLTSAEYERSFKIAGFNPPTDQPLRLVKVGAYLSYPCGGTHVNSSFQINDIQITAIKNKKGNIRVYYSCPL